MTKSIPEGKIGRSEKYLTFNLGGEQYGLEILKVREIIGIMDITRVPRTPEFIRGIINLRGKVIPVIDLRKKFTMMSIDDTEQTCIIVVDMLFENNLLLMGIIVDSVSEVLDIDSEEIEDTPIFGSSVTTDFIQGIAKTKGGVKILLNIEKVLTTNEILTLPQVSAEESLANQ